MKRRLARLEKRARGAACLGGDSEEHDTGDLFRAEFEAYRAGEAGDLVYNERERAFYARDGRLALSETYVNIPAWFGDPAGTRS